MKLLTKAIEKQILENHHIPGSVLRPLVMETMDKASSHSAAEVQTGPVSSCWLSSGLYSATSASRK